MEQTSSRPVNPLGTEPVGRLVIKFAIPSIIAMLVSAMYNIVDQIFIGQGVGLLGNTATNVAFPLTTTSLALGLLFGLGGASNMNLALGRKQDELASAIAGTTMTLLISSGVLLCAVVLIFTQPLLIAFGATEDVLPYALDYTRVLALGFPAFIFTKGMSSIIRGDGSPRYSMICMLSGAIINVILDPLFIFVFNWGMAGAAWATIIGQYFSATVAFLYIRRFRTISPKKQDFVPKLCLFLDISKLGVASFINQLASMIVQIVMNNVLKYYGALSEYGSNIPIACAGIVTKVAMLVFSFGVGFGQGSQPIIGYNYGARQYDRVRQAYLTSIKYVLIISVTAFVLFQTFPRQIISVFGDGSESYFRFAERFFRIYMFMIFAIGIQPATSSLFTSIGKAYKGIFISLTRQVIFLLPLLALLPAIYGIEGVMYTGPIADAASIVAAVILVGIELKKMKKLEAAKAREKI